MDVDQDEKNYVPKDPNVTKTTNMSTNNNAQHGFGIGFNLSKVPEKMDVDQDEKNYVPKDPNVTKHRNEIVQSILSLTDVITEKERKVETAKLIYENEVAELEELQNRKKDLIAQKGCLKRAERMINQKKTPTCARWIQ
jgi:hypothetical protein